MKKRLVTLGSVFAFLILFGLGVWPLGFSSAGMQETDKIIEKSDGYDPPVKIILVQSKIGVIETGKKIAAGDDWLKGLTVRVFNESDKPVNGVSVQIQFCRPENQAGELDLVAPVGYGHLSQKSPRRRWKRYCRGKAEILSCPMRDMNHSGRYWINCITRRALR